MTKWYGVVILMLWIAFLSIDVTANPTDERNAFAKQLHDRGYADKSIELNTLKQECGKKPENQHFEPQSCDLSSMFESQYDSGKKDEDPLKAHFAQKNKEASKNKHPNQPSLGEAEFLLKDKHQFQISFDDDLFKNHQKISEVPTESKESFFQKGQLPSEPKPLLEDKILTCRKGVPPILHSCEKKLILKAVPQEDLVKTVTATFTARCYNLVTFSINLKTGKIDISQCENPGPTSISIDNPIGEPDYPAKTTVELIKVKHFGEGGVDFRAGQMTPSHSNGFTASFTAFQPKTGKKHDENKNHVRGGLYVWKITMPRKPLLEEHWEGCEDFERRQIEKTCEEVFSEQQHINAPRKIADYPEPVIRTYWSENKEFLCGWGRDIDECEALLEQKCEQIDSKCIDLKDNICIEYENTFRCSVPDYQKTDGLSYSEGTLNFLSGKGGAVTSGYEVADFAEAITGFSALTEMGKTMEDGLGGIMGNPNNPSVFKGECRQCRVNLGSFVRDCCKLKGIFQGLLGKCNTEEQKLAIAAVKNKRCVKINGRYCHKKVAKICVEKRDSYCCYGSQLARILQEIAHFQLGIPWGDAEHPNCSSLTASQLSQLNFDTPYAQQKLSEILSEVQATTQEKFNRVQQAVAAAKSLQVQAKDWEKKQTKVEQATKRRIEKQKQLSSTGIKQ